MIEIENLWYKNTIIYSLDLKTFMDANGDGIGDFEGLMQRLDYLNSVGIDTIWLAPFYPTPDKDNGYDIADYYGVDPHHGSSGDFVEFMQQAKQRGIKVIIDLVVNHTSDTHPWFQAARSDENSKYHHYYVWSKKRPADWNKGMVFPRVQKATWTYDKKAKKYYFHRFYDFQPDLNMGKSGGEGRNQADCGLLDRTGHRRPQGRCSAVYHRHRRPGKEKGRDEV